MSLDAQLAGIAAASYLDPPDFTAMDVQAIQRTIDDKTVIAFRGTSAIGDWIRDLAWRPICDPKLGWCHAGFLTGGALYMAKATASSGNPPILTGHSLGGALALVVGALMALSGRPPAAVVTFGAPRVGMGRFTQSLASVEVRQYRRGDDPIPDVPFFIWPLLRFAHVRSLIAIGKPMVPAIECHRIGGYVTDVGAMGG